MALTLSALESSGVAPAWAQRDEAEVFVANAIVAYGERRYQDAITALEEALRLDPDNVNALYYTGLVNVALERFEPAVEALERARRLQPRDPSVLFQLGALYFGLGRYDEAQPLLEEVFARNPRVDSLGYYVGFMRYRKKDYQGALRAFRAGSSDDPDVQQLTRFYGGLALGVLGLPAEASAELEEALKVRPASPLTGPAERLRGAIVATAGEQRRFRAQVRLGVLYDTNVSVIPELSNDPLVQALRGRDKSSPGELGAIRLDYSFFRQGGFEAIGTFSLFAVYYNRLSDFSIVNPLAGVTVAHRGVLGSVPYQASLQYAMDFFTLGDAPFVLRNTVVPSVALAWNSGNISVIQTRLQSEKFYGQGDIPGAENQNGINYMVGVTHLFRFLAGKVQLGLGYQFDYDDTEGSNFVYVGNRALASAQYMLPWYGITLSNLFDVWLRNYVNTNTVLPVAAPNTVQRFDVQYTNQLDITLPLPHNLALTLDWQFIVQRSNLEVFRYTRNVVSLIMTWTY
jgi:tetratricopeptide (TPR) repeat protein